MRIRSQFKDYYDGQQKYISGEGMEYIRKVSWEYSNLIIPKMYHIRFNEIVIGFCGTLYRCLHHPKFESKNNWLSLPRDNEDFTVYNIDEYVKYQYLFNKDKDRELVRKAEAYFTPVKDDLLFVKNNCPVFIARVSYGRTLFCYHTLGEVKKLEFPPDEILTLKKYQFETLFPAAQAYMEIESYINGTLAREYKSEPPVSNSDKINLAGFDKNSFKKH